MDNIITQEQINDCYISLLGDERATGTVAKYRCDLAAFVRWLDGRIVTKETAAEWKMHLLNSGYAPSTINSMLAPVRSSSGMWNLFTTETLLGNPQMS